MERPISRKWIRVFALFSVLVMPLLLSACGSTSSLGFLNISGKWNVFYVTNGATGESGPDKFAFGVSGKGDITGSTAKGQAITGQISGTDISFSFVDGDGATNTSTGTVSDDNSSMSGTWTNSNGQSGTWHAVIALTPQVNVAGNWNMFQTTSGVTAEQAMGLFTFGQSGYSISGKTPDDKSLVGSIGIYDICFFWSGSDGVTDTFAGTVTADGATMSGTWSDSNGKSGTWRATKD